MVAVNTCGSTAYRHQFTASRTTTTFSFFSMLGSQSSQSGSANDFTNLFSSGENDALLSRLYEHMTGQTVGTRSGITSGPDETDWFIHMSLSGNSGKVDTSRVFNEASKGDKTLTAEDLRSLRAKYDMDNLSAQDRHNLLCDLTDMGVWTAETARFEDRLLTVEKSTISLTYTVVYANAPSKAGVSLLRQLMDMLAKESEALDFMSDLAKKPDGARHKVTVAKLEDGIAHHQKLVDVLSQLTC